MKASELRKLSNDDLRTELSRLQKELTNMKFRTDAEHERNTAHQRNIRKDIARIYTILRERELEESRKDERKKA